MDCRNAVEQKIAPGADAALEVCKAWRSKGEKMVFTNGCFDLFHAGHAHSLLEAARLGNRLVVGLNDDSSVKALKGNDRPFVSWEQRALILAALTPVDLVVPFSGNSPEPLIRLLQPDVLVKGADYAIEAIAGAEFVKACGGQVVCIPLLSGFSGTILVEKIRHG